MNDLTPSQRSQRRAGFIQSIIDAQPLNVQRAILWLERRGRRFCIDFGYDNAIAIKREMEWERRQRARKVKRKTIYRSA